MSDLLPLILAVNRYKIRKHLNHMVDVNNIRGEKL